MSEVPAVAFAFTKPDAVVYIGKGWTDAKNRRYRIHVFPPLQEGAKLPLSKDRPNVVLVRRVDKVTGLNECASKLHRIIFLGAVDELLPLGVPILDAVTDDQGKLKSAPPRANVDFYNRKIEDDAAPFDLAPPRKKGTSSKKKKRKQKKKPLPNTLATFLDEIEPYLDEGSVWHDLEAPVLHFFVGTSNVDQFQGHCKGLAKAGVPKSLSKAYFRWAAVKDEGLTLSSSFDIVIRNLEDGVAVNISSIAKKTGVSPDDLATLYTLYRAELEEKE